MECQYGYADEKGEDDIINVNTKTKEVQVTKTDDDVDIVSVDGAKPVKAEKGVTEALYKSKGSYNISHLYATGMDAVDNAIITLIGAKFTSWLFRGIAGLFARDAAEEGLAFNKGVLESFSKHAFAGGRHADLGLSVESMASKGLNLVEQNMSLLKAGDNTLIGNINGIQKSFKAFVQDGKVMSVNMYPGVSNRVTQGTVINFGNIKW